MWPNFDAIPRPARRSRPPDASLRPLVDSKNVTQEIRVISKERVVDHACQLRRAQKERMAAPLGDAKKKAKLHEFKVAQRLGVAVDTYEHELNQAVKQVRDARNGQP